MWIQQRRRLLSVVISYNNKSLSSPITNKYFPEQEDDFKLPSDKLRELEVNLNKCFRIYKDQYYNLGTISSVYAWDLGETTIEDGFAVAILIKNSKE